MFVKQTCWGICHWPAPCAGDYCSLGQSLGDMKNSEIATKRVEIKPMNHQKMRICSTIQGCRYGKEIKEQWMPQQSMPQMLIGECPNVPNLCPLSGYHLPNCHALGFTPRNKSIHHLTFTPRGWTWEGKDMGWTCVLCEHVNKMPTTNEFDIMDKVYKRCRAGRKPQYKCIFGGLGGGGWGGWGQ